MLRLSLARVCAHAAQRLLAGGRVVRRAVVRADKLAQAYVIAVAMLVSGVLQLAVQLPALRALGLSLRLRLAGQPRRRSGRSAARCCPSRWAWRSRSSTRCWTA